MSKSIDFSNTGDTEQSVQLVLNGKAFFANDQQIIAEITRSPIFAEFGFPLAAWDWLIKNHYAFNPYSGDQWQHAPYLLLNSLGFGLCDDAASIFYSLVTSYGYGTARIWSLDGHVVCEVFDHGKWELYDPNLQAVYIDGNGEIAGYDYVSQHLTNDYAQNLQNSRFAGVVSPSEVGYSDYVLDLYRTTDDNAVSGFSMEIPAPFSQADPVFKLPPGASLHIDASNNYPVQTIYGETVPEAMAAVVHFGQLHGYTFEYPLVPVSVTGSGNVVIDGTSYQIGSDGLAARLADRSAPIESISVDTSGADNTITYLLNPVRYSLSDAVDLQSTVTGSAIHTAVAGSDGADTLGGGAGALQISGFGGDDILAQATDVANGAAGSVLDGGDGNDHITFSAIQSYTGTYVSLAGGAGNDVIEAGTHYGQYIGSIQISGGSGDDVITTGHIEGGTGGQGYIDGGDGNDVITVVDTWGGVGIWGNAKFEVLGGAGNDVFELEGMQLNVLGTADGAQLDGGAGLDTLHWNGSYNLTIGGAQNPGLGLYSGYRQELAVSNIERVDLAHSGASGLTLEFSAADVAAISAGSDFDRASLGLGLAGTGNTLLVDTGSNAVDLAGWSRLGGATVDGAGYMVYQSGSAYMGISSLVLTATDGGDTLSGYSSDDALTGGAGNDTLAGGGGNDVISGGAGDDHLSQGSALANGAAGSMLDGGDGNDTITFTGRQAYTGEYVTIRGGAGDDVVEAAVHTGQYIGSVQLDGGAGNDLIEIGHIEGSTGGLGYVDGGDGNDVIRLVDTWYGVGIWGNSKFGILGGAGDDSFDLAGTQVNVAGGTGGAKLDGGAGFDTLFWNGMYNLTIGGAQNPAVGLFSGYKQELNVANIEHLDLVHAGVSGLNLAFSAQDVAAITSGSDFDLSTLGLGLSGTGNALFVDAGSNTVDLSGWSRLGSAAVNGTDYAIYESGSSHLGVSGLDVGAADAAGVLRGYSGDDTITGNGTSESLYGGAGDDTLAQLTPVLNGAAGSHLDGGDGNDNISFSARQAYTGNYVSISGGAGDDVIHAAVDGWQYTGSIQIDGDGGNDVIEVGHIEGSSGGNGYVNGGDGDDLIRVLDTWGGIGIWGNSKFALLGGAGNDRFDLGGTQLNVLGSADGAQLDGGAGFDTLYWTGNYNLTIGGSQNPALGLYSGYRQEIKVGNIESIDLLQGGATGLNVKFSSQDVAAITAGSDFDLGGLGLGLSGTGHALFVNAGNNSVDLTGWDAIGSALVNGSSFHIYHAGTEYLGIADPVQAVTVGVAAFSPVL